MADTKSSALTALAGADSAAEDLFLLVDVSDTTQGASGTLKNMTRAELAAALPERKNVIINGDFRVWPEGDTFTSVSDGDYSAAQWTWLQSGAGVVDVARITTSLPTVAESGRLISNGVQVDVTTADAAIVAGDYYSLTTLIEGYGWAGVAQQPMILSFWHKHTKPGTYCISVKNSGSDRTYVAEYTQGVSDTWERAEISILASPSAGTWDYTTGIGLRVNFPLAIGSTFHTTADAWQAGNYFATSSQVNALDVATNFFRIAGVQLESGTVATDFEQIPFSVEQRLTERYFKIINGEGVSSIVRVSDRVRAGFAHSVEMRAAPTITLLDTTPNLIYSDTSQDGVSATLLSTAAGAQASSVAIGGFTGLTVGDVAMFGPGDLLQLDARL